MKIYDVTRPMSSTLAIWPGNPEFVRERFNDMSKGDIVNISVLHFGTHLGTHVDAPYHFMNDGATLEQVPLETFIGPVTVVTVSKGNGPLTPADFPNLDWSRVKRLIVHSESSHRPIDRFYEEYVYPSLELVAKMGEHGVVLFGTDAPTVDGFGHPVLASHLALQSHNIIILEGLLLTDVPDGEYELVALPLKIIGGDGCPVRAILRQA